MKRSCLVTGGAGFIGSHIVERLLHDGHSVRVVDDFSTGKHENLIKHRQNVELIEGSIASREIAREAVDGIDVVFHHAAIASVPRSVDNPIESNTTNTDGTLELLIAARDAGVKRFIYAGSSSAYGNSPELPKREDMLPEPLSPYAVSKLSGEMYCQIFHSLYGLETVVLRYFNVFGPRQDPNSEYAAVIPKFVTLMLNGKAPKIFGDGLQSRDFSYVDNNVNANILAMSAPKAVGQVMNVACGHAVTLLELVNCINEILGTDIKPVLLAERPGDVKHSVADISKAVTLLGYQPEVTFKQGLARVVKSFQL